MQLYYVTSNVPTFASLRYFNSGVTCLLQIKLMTHYRATSAKTEITLNKFPCSADMYVSQNMQYFHATHKSWVYTAHFKRLVVQSRQIYAGIGWTAKHINCSTNVMRNFFHPEPFRRFAIYGRFNSNELAAMPAFLSAIQFQLFLSNNE